MAKINRAMNQILSGNEARLEVNLKEMFEGEVPDSSSFRQSIGQAIIDKIRERTEENNEDIRGRSFAKYSKEYIDSIDFKAYGKSASDVNLKQTGDMLGLMDIIEEKKDKIIIGWSDSEQAAKAHGHITGHVGRVRNFLGLPIDDLESIADEFKDELPQSDETSRSTTSLTEEFLSGRGQNVQTLGQIIRALEDEE